MARHLNIERRRKRIRHYYTARRQRSPLRRAFTFWWGAAVLLALTGSALSGLIFHGRFALPARDVGSRWELPSPSMRLLVASASAIESVVRAGNARRVAIDVLKERDVGISLEAKLPELKPLPKALQAEAPRIVFAREEVPDKILPPVPADALAESALGKDALVTRLDASLQKAEFALEPAKDAPPAGAGSAQFWLKLDAYGRAEVILRLYPAGEETAWLRHLRVKLEASRGKQSAEGTVTIIWNREETL